MRSSWNAVAVVILAASMSWSCSGGGGGSDPGPDTTPPRVISTNPGDGATAVAKNAAITATFSEAVDPTTLSTTSFTLSHGGGSVAGSVAWNGGTRTATFTPSSALAPSTPYTATLAGVEDAAGNPMAGAHVWSFETSAPAGGDLDPTFGTLGMARTDLGGAYFDGARGMAIQPDDRIVVVGGSDVQLEGGIGSAFTLVRYDADGGLDPTFGPGGIVTTAIGACGAVARAVAIQEDGMIVAAGTCGFDVAVARYEADGTLDPTFAASGIELLTLPSSDETANAVAIDGSGNIVVAGTSDLYSTATNSSDFLVARFTPAGVLDSTFSTDGLAFVDFKPSTYTSGSALWDGAYAVTIEGDGRILVVGHAENSAWLDDVALARLNADGTSAGKATHSLGSWWQNDARAVAIQPDGKIVAAGMVDTHYLGVMRFSGFSLDTTFNGTGFVKTDMRNDDVSSEDYAYAVTLQPDGKIVVAGRVKTAGGSPYPQDFAVARYLATGALDTSFGAGGKVITDAGGIDDVLIGVGRQSDGKIVVAGTSGGEFVVARYVQ